MRRADVSDNNPACKFLIIKGSSNHPRLSATCVDRKKQMRGVKQMVKFLPAFHIEYKKSVPETGTLFHALRYNCFNFTKIVVQYKKDTVGRTLINYCQFHNNRKIYFLVFSSLTFEPTIQYRGNTIQYIFYTIVREQG